MNAVFHSLNLRRCLLILFLLVSARAGAAGLHIAGGELTYRYIGNSKYELTLDMYTHCLSKPGRIFFNVASPNSNFTPFSVEAASITDIGEVTLLCNGAKPQAQCSSSDSMKFGIRHFRAIAEVTLSNQNVCEFIFSYKGGTRSFWSTNGGAGEAYYTEAYLRNCSNMNISSPAFGEKPQFLAAQGGCQHKKLSVTNRNTSAGNSVLTFALTAPLTEEGATITYNQAFTAAAPVSFIKDYTPNSDSIYCRGFRFDSLTGTLFFNAAKKESAPICIQITNTVNGVVVSRVTRDYLLYVMERVTYNRWPRIVPSDTHLTHFTIMAGIPYRKEVKTFDQDPGDSLRLSAYNLPEGSSFKVKDTTKKWPVGIFTWTP